MTHFNLKISRCTRLKLWGAISELHRVLLKMKNLLLMMFWCIYGSVEKTFLKKISFIVFRKALIIFSREEDLLKIRINIWKPTIWTGLMSNAFITATRTWRYRKDNSSTYSKIVHMLILSLSFLTFPARSSGQNNFY